MSAPALVPPVETGNLAQAVCAVMQAVEGVAKNGKNAHFRYSYATHEDIVRACRVAMAENGLVMVPTTVQHLGTVQINEKRYRTEVLVTYRLMHTSGESCLVTVPAAGVDGEDKGPYKAMTGAHKYALLQAFLIPTGDDPEQSTGPAPRQEGRNLSNYDRGHDNKWRNNDGDAPACPACGSDLWDNREKRAGGWRGPAWKCKGRDCTGHQGEPWLQWESKPIPGLVDPSHGELPPVQDGPPPHDDEDLPF